MTQFNPNSHRSWLVVAVILLAVLWVYGWSCR